MKIFVYDNLKTGGVWNHLLRSSTLLGAAHTLTHHPLVIKDSHPYLLRETGGKLVWGEVYNIDSKVLVAIDSLLSNPTWYQRHKAQVLINGAMSEVWVYYLNQSRYKALGNWQQMTFHSIFNT